MKISKAKLKNIVKEELEKILLSEAKSPKYPDLTQTVRRDRKSLLNKRNKVPAPKNPEQTRSIPAVIKLFPSFKSVDIKREIELSARSTNHVGDILDYLVGWMFPYFTNRGEVDTAALEVAESWDDPRQLDIDEDAAKDFLKKRTEVLHVRAQERAARAKVGFDKERSLPPQIAGRRPWSGPNADALRQLADLTNPTKE